MGGWVALEGSVDLFWVYGNLRGCSRGIYSQFDQVSNFARFRVAGSMKKSQIMTFFDIFQVGVWVAIEGSVGLFWVYGNLRGCSRGICS